MCSAVLCRGVARRVACTLCCAVYVRGVLRGVLRGGVLRGVLCDVMCTALCDTLCARCDVRVLQRGGLQCGPATLWDMLCMLAAGGVSCVVCCGVLIEPCATLRCVLLSCDASCDVHYYAV